MLKASLSTLHPVAKLAFLTLLVLVFLLFSSLFAFVALMPFLGTGVLQILTNPDYGNPAVVNSLKAVQIINMVFGLLLPAWLFVWLTIPKPVAYLKADRKPDWLPFTLAILFMVAAQPAIAVTSEWNSQMQLPGSLKLLQDWMQSMEQQASVLTEAFLGTTSIPGFLVNVFMIALLPAICEEVVFRGVLARLFRDWTQNQHLAVVLSAFIFAAIHMQFFGFLPRFLLGVALAYLFFRTGSLWVPIIAHFTNNLLSVAIEFLYRKGIISLNTDQLGFTDSIWAVMMSFLISVALLLYIIKSQKPEAAEI